MDQMSYKERLEILHRAGFTAHEVKRLCVIRRMYVENEQNQVPTNISHLHFIRWLVKHGRLNEHFVQHTATERGEA